MRSLRLQGLLALICATALAERPALIPNTVRERASADLIATGHAGSVEIQMRALLAWDGNTEIALSTGDLQVPGTERGRISRVRVKVLDAQGLLLFIRIHNDLDQGGAVTLTYGGLQAGNVVEALVSVVGVDGSRTDVTPVTQVVKLRPLPYIGAVYINQWALSGLRTLDLGLPVTVYVHLLEASNQGGARADVVLRVDGVEVDRAERVWLDAGGQVAVVLSHQFDSVGTKELQVELANVEPPELDPGWSTRTLTVEVDVPSVSYVASASTLHESSFDHILSSVYDDSGGWSQENTLAFEGTKQFTTFQGSCPMDLPLPIRRLSISTTIDDVLLHTADFVDLPFDPETHQSTAVDYDSALALLFEFRVESGYCIFIYSSHTFDLLYYSREYLRRWLGVDVVEEGYQYSEFPSRSASSWQLGTEVSWRLELVDALGRSLVLTPKVTLEPFAESTTQPWSCSEGRDGQTTNLLCHEYASHTDGYRGQTSGRVWLSGP